VYEIAERYRTTQAKMKKSKDVVSELREKYSKQNARMLYVNSDECYEKSQKLFRAGYSASYSGSYAVSSSDSRVNSAGTLKAPNPLTSISMSITTSPKPQLDFELKTRLNELRNEQNTKFPARKIIVIDQRDLKLSTIRKRSSLAQVVSKDISREVPPETFQELSK
jgi:hypothetical protein